MIRLILKFIIFLAGGGTGVIVAGFSSIFLLFAMAFRASGSDVGFESSESLSFVFLFFGGVSGAIAGGMVFIRPGFSTAAFSVASVLCLIAAAIGIIATIALIEFSVWSIVPVVIFGVAAPISWVVRPRRINATAE